MEGILSDMIKVKRWLKKKYNLLKPPLNKALRRIIAIMKFYEKLVRLRKKRGWSQTELGQQVGVHIAHLSRLENGKSQPSVEMLWKIAKTLNVSMDYFMDDQADSVIRMRILKRYVSRIKTS